MISFVAQSFPERNMKYSNRPKSHKIIGFFFQEKQDEIQSVQIIIKPGIDFMCGVGTNQWKTNRWQTKVKTRGRSPEKTLCSSTRRSRYRILPKQWNRPFNHSTGSHHLLFDAIVWHIWNYLFSILLILSPFYSYPNYKAILLDFFFKLLCNNLASHIQKKWTKWRNLILDENCAEILLC